MSKASLSPNDPKLSDRDLEARVCAKRREAKARRMLGFMAEAYAVTEPVELPAARRQLNARVAVRCSAWLGVDFGSSACGVPESSNVHAAVAMIDAVDNAVRSDDDLADGWIVELWNNAAHLGEVCETFGAVEQKLAERDCALR